MTADRNAVRAAEVWRRHRRAGRSMRGRSFWENLTFETWTFLTAMVCAILQICLEPALWWRWPPAEIPRSFFGWTAASLLFLAPVSGLLVEHDLARRAPPGTSVRFRVRMALFLGGCVPWLGVLWIPLWRHLMIRPPAWAVRSTGARLDLEGASGRLPRASPLHRLHTSGAFGVWLAATGVLLSFAGCFWLAGGGNRYAILGASIALHLAQAACMALYAESELRFTTQSRRRLRVISWLCLLPQPVPFFALLPVLWAEVEGPRMKTLVWSAYARLVGVGRLSVWLDLRLALRRQWKSSPWPKRWALPRGLEVSSPEGQAEAVRRTWVLTKSLFLPIEASLVTGWLAARTGGGPRPDYDPVGDPALRPWLLVTVLLAAFGLLHAVVAGLAPLLRLRTSAPLGPSAAGLYLFVTQAALAFALLAGPLAAHGKFRELALLTTLGTVLAAMLSVLLMLLDHLVSQSTLPLATLAAWPAGFLILAVPPVAVALRPDLAPVGLGLALLVPVADLAVGIWRLPWLLYPLRWRDVFDEEMLARERVRLAFLALVAILPLGGLALPGWILLDRAFRLRLSAAV